MVVNKKESICSMENKTNQPNYTIELSEKESKILYYLVTSHDYEELDKEEFDTIMDLGDAISKFNHE